MKKFLLCVPAILMAASAHAALLDFSTVQGSQGSPLVVPGGATLSHESSVGVIRVGIGSAGQADGFCFLMSGSCEAGGSMVFSQSITNLTFDIDGWNPGDSVDITAFLGVNLLSTVTFNTSNQVVNDFSALTIDRLVFVDNSTGAGVGYSTFAFDPGTPAIPLPASAFLLLGGVGALAAFGRRRTAV